MFEKVVASLSVLATVITVAVVGIDGTKVNAAEYSRVEETVGVVENEQEISEEVEVKEIILPEVNIAEVKISEFNERKTLLEDDDRKTWFTQYKQLCEEYKEWVEMPTTIYDVFTEEEIYIMQRCIETETYDAPFDAKCNIAGVILNRIEAGGVFGNNAVDVVTMSGQFAYGRTTITEDTILALEYAYSITDTSGGALYFHSNGWCQTFYGANWIFTDEVGHHFYG